MIDLPIGLSAFLLPVVVSVSSLNYRRPPAVSEQNKGQIYLSFRNYLRSFEGTAESLE